MRKTELSDVAAALMVLEPTPTRFTQNKSICFTGHLGLPRHEYTRICEMAGMRVEKAVRYGLTYLCTNSDWSAGSVEGVSNKFAKAKANGVKIISEKELHNLLSKPDPVED